MATRGTGWGARTWLGVAAGALIGSVLRLAVDAALPAPWDLVVVNALGSIALLVLVLGVWPRRPDAPRWLRDGLGTGLLGAFTTLSGVSVVIAVTTPVPPLDGPGLFAAATAAGILGTLVRHATAVSTARLRFPLGILVVNVLGSLVAGLALAALARGALDPAAAVVLVTGACGGLTTFSTVVAETVRAWLAGTRALAFLVLLANFGLGALAAWVGALL